jgi:hypothetical protein
VVVDDNDDDNIEEEELGWSFLWCVLWWWWWWWVLLRLLVVFACFCNKRSHLAIFLTSVSRVVESSCSATAVKADVVAGRGERGGVPVTVLLLPLLDVMMEEGRCPLCSVVVKEVVATTFHLARDDVHERERTRRPPTNLNNQKSGRGAVRRDLEESSSRPKNVLLKFQGFPSNVIGFCRGA